MEYAVMSELGLRGQEGNEKFSNDYNAMYKEVHPDAVEDHKKAEVMAYASKRYEEEAVAYSNAAIDAASEGRPVTAESKLGTAQNARRTADNEAKRAGEIYDEAKGALSSPTETSTTE